MAINSYSGVSAANQVAALAALEGPQEFINDMMIKFDKRRNLIVEGLNSLSGIKCNKPGGAFYAFPNISETGMTGEFCRKMFIRRWCGNCSRQSFGNLAQIM